MQFVNGDESHFNSRSMDHFMESDMNWNIFGTSSPVQVHVKTSKESHFSYPQSKILISFLWGSARLYELNVT